MLSLLHPNRHKTFLEIPVVIIHRGLRSFWWHLRVFSFKKKCQWSKVTPLRGTQRGGLSSTAATRATPEARLGNARAPTGNARGPQGLRPSAVGSPPTPATPALEQRSRRARATLELGQGATNWSNSGCWRPKPRFHIPQSWPAQAASPAQAPTSMP